MSTGKPIVVAIAADTRDFKAPIDTAKTDLTGLANTAETQGRRASLSIENVGEHSDRMASASSQAAGAMGDLGGALGQLPGPLGALGGGMESLAPTIMGVTGASDLLNLATEKFPGLAKLASAGARGLGVAVRFATGPVGIVIALLAAAAVGLTVAYKKSETFRNIVNGAFAAVKTVAASLGDAFKAVWQDITKWLGKAWDYISGLPGKIRGAFTGIWSGLADGLKSSINSVLHLPLTIPKIDTHIPGVGKVGGQTLIPALASGGITSGPTLALLGDNPGGREAVIPLDKYELGGSRTYNLTVNVPATANPAETGRAIVAAITAYESAGGRRRATGVTA